MVDRTRKMKKSKQRKKQVPKENLLDSCGGPTRTNDLQVMSLASYQLLHPAMFSECKGKAKIRIEQTLSDIFAPKGGKCPEKERKKCFYAAFGVPFFAK